jgi:TPR repeat protein
LQKESTAAEIDEGIEWVMKAAQQGNAEAQLQLGIVLINLSRNEQDIREGFRWLGVAQKQGIPEAQEIIDNFCLKLPALCAG